MKKKDEKSGEQFYLIMVENKSKKNKENSHEKREEKEEFLGSLVSEIDNLIIGNIDTYEDPSVLDEIEHDSAPSLLRKRSDDQEEEEEEEEETKYTHVISTVEDESIIFTYLSEDLVPLIKDLPNVKTVVPDIKMESYSANPGYLKNLTDTYEWKKPCVRGNVDSYLSLISQDKYENSILSTFDSNYYYPGSGGKGINIFVVDSGFDFNHPDFSNKSNGKDKNERIVKCIASFTQINTNNEAVKSDYGCNDGSTYHGSEVANIVGGLTNGVASNANIYGVSIRSDLGYLSSLLKALQYIDKNYLNLKNPDNVKYFLHKTVINISSGINYIDYMKYSFLSNGDPIKHLYKLINRMSNKGSVFVTSAGNNSYSVDDFQVPCTFDNVICVGSTDNIGINDHPHRIEYSEIMEQENNRTYSFGEWIERSNEAYEKFIRAGSSALTSRYISSKNYRTAYYSNYGKNVDIYAPGFVNVFYHDNDGNHERFTYGTSYSAPIVAGVAATLMSEKPYKHQKE